jgi:4-amino-4-deoxy-L-arabinose transferase-like glycosyltransferase
MKDCRFWVNPKKKHIALFVLSLALLVRLYDLGAHSIWVDEAGTASLVETYLATGEAQYPSGMESSRSKPFILVTAASVFLFSLNSFALRLPSVVFGVLSIIAVYVWSKSIFEERMQLMAPTILSLSSWHVAMSQNARMYMMFQFLYLCVFLSIHRYLATRNIVFIVSAAIFAYLSVLTHVTGYVLSFTIPLVLIISSGKLSKLNYILGSILSISTMVVAERYYFDFDYILDTLAVNLATASSHMVWITINIPVMLILSVYGSFRAWDLDTRLFYICSTAVIPPSMIYFFFIDLPASRYIFFTLPFLALLSAYGLKSIIHKYDLTGSKRTLLMILFFLFFIGSSGNPINHELGSHSPQPDFKSAYSLISSQASENDTLIAGRPLPASYYFRNPDYVLWETYLDENHDSYVNGTDSYSGSPFIMNRRELIQTISTERDGWIVATDSVQQGLPDDMRVQIRGLELVKKSEKIKVWRFGGDETQ